LPTSSDIANYYDDPRHSISSNDSAALNDKRLALQREVVRHVSFIASLAPPSGTILDVGCGYGFFLQAIANRNFTLIGVEPSNIRRSAIHVPHNVQILSSFQELPIYVKADIINLYCVLEHVRSPVQFLQSLSAHLTEHSHLVIVVPNVSDYLLSHNQQYRTFYWKRAHLSYFSEVTLRRCIEEAGFLCQDVRHIQRWGVPNAMHWMLYNEAQSAQMVLRAAAMRGFEWLDECLETHLAASGNTDAMLVRASLNI